MKRHLWFLAIWVVLAVPAFSQSAERIDALFNTSGTPVPVIPNLTSIHGEDVLVDGSVALDSVFSAGRDWDPAVWDVPTGVNFDVGGVLPTLKNMPAGVQDPKVK